MRVLSLGILTVFVLAMAPIVISALPGWSARPNVLLVPLAVAVMRWYESIAVAPDHADRAVVPNAASMERVIAAA